MRSLRAGGGRLITQHEAQEPRIAAAVITGDGPEKEAFERLFSSLAEVGVAEIFVSYNGSSRSVPKLHKLSPIPVWVEKFPWQEDFSVARNHSFSMVPRDKFQWITWADSDDSVIAAEGESLFTLIDSIDPRVRGVLLRYEYGIDPETGVCIIEQWRERLFSTKSRWKWRFPIHEIVGGEPFCVYSRREQVWIRHHRETGKRDDATRIRNRKIIATAREKDPGNPRLQFYFASEVIAEAFRTEDEEEKQQHAESAVVAFQDFLATEPNEEDTYVANHRMAEAYRLLGQHDKAIQTELTGIAIRPTWSSSWVGSAVSFLDSGDLQRAGEFADICIKVAVSPVTTQPIEPLDLTYTPKLLRGLWREQSGDFEGALEDFQEASKTWFPEDLKKRIEAVVLALREQALREREESSDNVNEALRADGSSPSRSPSTRSITFFTKQLFEPWHPLIEREGGMGGAETCVMRLARLYALEGWDVAVYGTPGDHSGRDEDGVEWFESREFDPTDPVDVIVSSRTPELFDATINAGKKVLWLHDVHAGAELDPGAGQFGDRLEQIDTIVSLSPWHQKHLSAMYGVSPIVIPNGIDLALYEEEPELREGSKMIYSSSPDRGLDVLLSMWPDIKQELPDATLDVFYGWNAIDKIIASQPDTRLGIGLKNFKDYIEELLEKLGGDDSGIKLRGRIPQHQLAQEEYKMNVWAYPTFFAETHCISALEMQAAGVIPVTSQLGALETTIVCDDLKVRGWPNNVSYREMWLSLLLRVVNANREEKERWIRMGRKHALNHGWERIFQTYWLSLTLTQKHLPLQSVGR